MNAPERDSAGFAEESDEDTIEMVLAPHEMIALLREAEEQLAATLAGTAPASPAPAETKVQQGSQEAEAAAPRPLPQPTAPAATAPQRTLTATPAAPTRPSAAAVVPQPAKPAPFTAAPQPTPRASSAPPIASRPASATKVNARPARDPSKTTPRFRQRRLATVTGAVSIAAVVIALASVVRHSDTPKPHWVAPPPLPPAATAPAVANTHPAEEAPVKFKNPFDHSEVFEFPAGTTPEEARQAVAQILMQRAQERHPVVARSAKRH